MTAVFCPRSYELAGGDFNACMLIGVALEDISTGTTPPDLDLQLARYAAPLHRDRRPKAYIDLRGFVEEQMNREWGGDPELTFADEALDGEVLWVLYLLTRGVEPCRQCFKVAYRLQMMRARGDCPAHEPDADRKAEEWRPIPGWEGLYEASDHGRVRSLTRPVRYQNGAVRLYQGRVLTAVSSRGRSTYPRVELVDGPRRSEYVGVHVLVMRTFVGPRPDGFDVCHNNGNPHDARLTNLRYASRSDNHADKNLHGTVSRGSRHGKSVVDEATVLEVVAARRSGMRGRVVAEKFGVNESLVSSVMHGRTWSWLTGIGAER